MYDGGKIIAGLIVFVALATFPIWYGVAGGAADKVPDPKIATNEKECVAAAAYMKTEHMDMLDRWREAVVRDGQREYTAPSGRKFEMSLTNTCMQCHSNKSEFCDQCHNYMGVSPYCWNCHVEPKEVQR